MTALDRALIKAYRQELRSTTIPAPVPTLRSDLGDLASHGSAILHSAEPVLCGPHFRPSATEATRTRETTTSSDFGDAFSHDAGQITFWLDVGIVGPPPAATPMRPREEVSATVRQSLGPPAEPVVLANEEPVVLPMAETVRVVHEPPPPVLLDPVEPRNAAEAVHLTSRPLSSFHETAPGIDEARPQLVVDRFEWPESCDLLRRQAAAAIEPFVAELAVGTKLRKAVALVSLERGAGCTTTVLCLARHLAAKGFRAVLVDADFDRPRLAEELAVNAPHGWDTALAGDVSLGEVLIESLEDQMVLAPLLANASPAVLASAGLRSTLVWRMLKEPYDVLLFDVGCVEDEAAWSRLKALAEAAPLEEIYMVCDARSTTPQERVACAHRFKAAGLACTGIIETFSC